MVGAVHVAGADVQRLQLECSECSDCNVAATLCPDSCTAASQEVGCDESCWTHGQWEEKCESTFSDGRCSKLPAVPMGGAMCPQRMPPLLAVSEPSSVDGAGAATELLQELYRSRLADRLSQGNLTCPASPPPLPASPSPLPTATALPPPLLPPAATAAAAATAASSATANTAPRPLPPARSLNSSASRTLLPRSDAGTASPLNSFTAVSSVFVLVALAANSLSMPCQAAATATVTSGGGGGDSGGGRRAENFGGH